MPVLLVAVVSVLTGYVTQIIVHHYRIARQAMEETGCDTTTSKDVKIAKKWDRDPPKPNGSSLLYGILTAGTIALMNSAFPEVSTFGKLALLGSLPLLVLLFAVDTIAYRLPFVLSFTLLGWQFFMLAAVGAQTGSWTPLRYALLASITYSGFLFLIFVLSRANLGFGDVILGLPLGALTGMVASDPFTAAGNALYALVLGSVVMIGAFIVTALISRKSKQGGSEEYEKKRRYLPFGPCLIAGVVLFLLIFS